MQKDFFDKTINFLLGASWAVVVFGALITFSIFSSFGFSLALFITVVFVIFSMFMVLILDAFLINRQKLDEVKKQTKLLEKIYEQNSDI